jgi:hypothetical protein
VTCQLRDRSPPLIVGILYISQHMFTENLTPVRDVDYAMQSNFDKTALSGRKPIRGRCPVRSDSFHRQNVQRLTGLPPHLKVGASLKRVHHPPAHRKSTVLVFWVDIHRTAATAEPYKSGSERPFALSPSRGQSHI